MMVQDKLNNLQSKSWLKFLILAVVFSCLLTTANAQFLPGEGTETPSSEEEKPLYNYDKFGEPETLTAGDATKKCSPSKTNGYFDNECPKDINGNLMTRDDIEAACLQKINAGQCLNTMPTSGVSRVPEDVCKRGPARNHNGMDYAAGEGTNVTAAADGYVELVSQCVKGGGRAIYMRHSKGGMLKSAGEFEKLRNESTGNYNKDTYKSVYMHLSDTKVSSGEYVTKGHVIGLVGGSNCAVSGGTPVDKPVTGGKNGGAYGAHLHFELRDGGDTVLDPMCSNIQGLCGGLRMDTTSCRKNCKDPNEECQSSTYEGGSAVDGTGDLSAVAAASGGSKCNWERYRSSYKSCIFCGVFKILFNTASTMADKAFNTFAEIIQKMVVLGAGLWIAFTIVSFISSVEVKEPSSFLKTIISQLFIVILVYALLTLKPSEFMRLALEPIFNTGLKLANIAMDGEECTNEFGIHEDKGLPASIGVSILCVIKNTQDKIINVMSLGSTAMCIGFRVKSWKQIVIFPHLGYVMVGLLLWITGMLLLVAYPFLLVDAVLKLSVAAALTPAAIGCFAFKITRKYVNKIFLTVMNSMLAFVFLSIMLYILIEQIEMVVGDTIKHVSVYGANDATFLQELAWTAVKPLQLIFIMLLGWSVLEEGEKFANEFAQGLSTDVGRSVGGLAVNTGHKMAKGAANITKGARQSIARGVKRAVGEKYQGAKSGMQRGWVKFRGTKNEDGSYTMNTRNKLFGLVGRKITKTVGADGTITRATQTGKLAGTERKKDDFIKSEVVKTKDGNQQITTEMITKGGQSMVNNDGSLNMVAMKAIRQNAKLDQNMVDTAIMNQVMKEQMPAFAHKMEQLHQSRTTNRYYDENGNEIFEITQINADGSKSVFRMTLSSQTNRAKIDVEETDKKGKQTTVNSSDGILNKSSTIEHKVDKDGKAYSVEKAKYSFSSYYSKYKKQPLDSLGNFSNTVPVHDMMFGETDMDNLKRQFYLKGRNENLKGFKK